MSNKTQNFTKGRHGENMARQYLENLGYQFIQSNFHTRYGEIDLIMIDCTGGVPPPILVFIEVKYKSISSPGTPQDMITAKKVHQILTTAQAFLIKNPHLAQAYPSHRLDAVCILGSTIKHYQNINL